jgi:hypothetical protein
MEQCNHAGRKRHRSRKQAERGARDRQGHGGGRDEGLAPVRNADRALREGHAPGLRREARQAVGGALHEQYVAGLDRRRAQALDGPAALS